MRSIIADASIAAMILILPPHGPQRSTSRSNTRFRRRAQLIRDRAPCGFQRGRRFIAARAKRDFLMLYEVESLSVLTGQEYMAKANNPSPLTLRTTKLISNSVRALAKVDLSLGIGTRVTMRRGSQDGLGAYRTLSGPGQHRHHGGRLFEAPKTAAIFGDRDTRVGHLPFTGFAAKLHDELDELDEPRGSHRVAFGHQSTGGVDRNAPAQGSHAALGEAAAFAANAQAEVLDLDDFCEGTRIVHLGDVDVLRSDAGGFIGSERRQPADVTIEIQRVTVGPHLERHGRHLCGPSASHSA